MLRLTLLLSLALFGCDDDDDGATNGDARADGAGGAKEDGGGGSGGGLGDGSLPSDAGPLPDLGAVDLGTPPDPGLGAVWANEGGDKVTQESLRATADADAVRNSVWDGERIRLFAARNEIVSFNLVLEAPEKPAQQVRIHFDRLQGPDGVIRSVPA